MKKVLLCLGLILTLASSSTFAGNCEWKYEKSYALEEKVENTESTWYDWTIKSQIGNNYKIVIRYTEGKGRSEINKTRTIWTSLSTRKSSTKKNYKCN